MLLPFRNWNTTRSGPRTVREGTFLFPKKNTRPERFRTGPWSRAKSRRAGDRVAFSNLETPYRPTVVKAPSGAQAYRVNGEYFLLPGRRRRRFY